MCLIAVAPKGTQKYSEFFLQGIRKAAVSNTDGIGYSYKRSKDNKVWISKGFKDVEKFIKALKAKRLKDDDELMVHLRIGNKGAKSEEMNHPFVLSSEDDIILSNTEYVKAITMVHNGTFNDYSIINSEKSDTFFFVKKFMAVKEIQDLLKRDSKLFKETFKEIIKTNKLAFIFNDDTPMITIGYFEEDQGYLFSNVSYKRDRYANIGGNEYYDEYENYHGRAWRGGSTNSHVGSAAKALEEANKIVDQRIENVIGTANSIPDRTPPFKVDNDSKLNDNLTANKTYVGSRKRTPQGLLEVDSKFDIMPPFSNDEGNAIRDERTMRNLYPAFNKAIYVPLTYQISQKADMKFVPMRFNYKHFFFTCTTGSQAIGLIRGLKYYMTEYDTNPIALHQIRPLITTGVLSTEYVYLTTEDLLRHCNVEVKDDYADSYVNLYRLIQKYDNISKKLFNCTMGTIKSAEGRGKQTTKFKDLKDVDVISLKIYKNYMTSYLYPGSAYSNSKFYESVQQSESRKELVN